MPGLDKLPRAFRDKLPRNLLDALEQLTAHEAKIMQALSDPQLAKLFAENPAAALRRMNIPISPLLARKLEEAARGGRLAQFRSHQLPNGQTLKPNVRLRFVKGGR